MTKDKVLISLEELPEEFELEDLFARLLIIQRVEEGVRQSENGETYTEAEARKRLSRWR